MAYYKEKIRKLLALAKSTEEHEAKAALLKARQLMAEHKYTEAELKNVGKQAVRDIRTDITCSKRRNPWIIPLSAVIGENYCCKSYRNRRYGEQTNYVGFIGLEDDVEICTAIFKYAVDCVLLEIKRIKKENQLYQSWYVKKLCDSYGYGFAAGVAEVFKNQEEEHKEQGWGLVLVMPQEVIEAAQHLGHEAFRSKAQENISSEMYTVGYNTGKEFDPTKRLAEDERACAMV